MKLLKWAAIVVVALVVIIAGAVVALPYIVPMERLVAEGTAQVEAATGRKLTVGGKPTLSVWPEVAISLESVTFANAPGAADANMLTVDAVRIAAPVLPLLSGEIEVKEFVLVKPDIRLAVDASGKPNWSFGEKAGATPAPGADKPAAGKAALPEELKDLKLGDVRIENGRISYADAKAGTTEVLENVNLKLTLPSLQGPLGADGDLVWKGDRIVLALNMAKPLAAIEGGASALKADLKGAHIDAGFDGTADFSKGLALAGDAGVKTPSIKQLAAWAAAPLAIEGDVLGPFEAKGKLRFAGPKISFTDAAIAIDAIRGDGDFAVDTSGKVPAITARLALGELDLNPYLPVPKEGQTGGPAASGPGTWSEEPIDFSGLKQLNADLDLSLQSLLVQKIRIGESALKATLQGGVLNFNLSRMALYGGQGVATVRIDAAKATPEISKQVKLAGINALPLLTDAAGFDQLEGKGDLSMTVRAVGASQAAMVKTAAGDGAFSFQDGAVKGFNLGAMMRKVESAFLDASAGETQKTDFSELKGTFKIAKGLVTNDDLSMLSPLFRVTGSGQSSLPARTVNYRVVPRAVASTTGQGGAADLVGVSVPVLITGPWHDLSFQPDLTGAIENLAKDPGKIVDSAKDVLKNPGKAVEGIGNTLPGGKDVDNAVQGIKNLFGK